MERLKQELLNEVENLQFVNLENLENIFLKESNVARTVLPWHYVKVYYAKYLFVAQYCDPESGEPFFTNNFKISADEMNRIVNDNKNKRYLHFFFCNVKLPGGNDLGLILRFSDIEDYENNGSYDSETDNSYFISNGGRANLLDKAIQFSNIIYEYKNGIGTIIESDSSKQKLTNYITYEMANIHMFNGFEHELTFELICKEEVEEIEEAEEKFRIGLVVYIKDKDRIHHTNTQMKKDYYEGYYDAGDLKP
ncbi:hypothetical protein [Chryseobacterium sp. ON_d1]|uniref:hypothetical protein n=1 Tax=Chryseobacterium sp. ON_d1 TaxID=2583211 RepID=UPI001158BCC0|nr:hypothetical protein [Chryseobacterium sp. ON_d1]GEJ46919.1 hypothetical protein CRS_35270 [Chryseobacterium sp. ON_d1]